MKLLEYEAKALLKEADIQVPKSRVLSKNATSTPSLPIVLKSQVPIGGRGKLGGVVIVENDSELSSTIERLLALNIRGFTPKLLLAEEKLSIKNEFYFSLVIDKPTARIELVAHRNGGVEVEKNNHSSFLRLFFDGKNFDIIGEQLAESLDLPSHSFALQDLVENSYHCFMKNDATLLEINPLILTNENRLIAGDCKMELDDAAAFRHPEWNFEATVAESNFVTLNEHGTVATIANGAGLAMATVDAVSDHGLTAANFLDIGGGASTASVLEAFERILLYPNITAIVINIFAGITRCDEIAKAIIAAKKEIDHLPPLYIRLAGTNYEAAAELLEDSGITLFASLEESLAAVTKEHTS